MKITKVEPILLSYEYKPDEQWGWSGGEVKVWHTSLVRVWTDEGMYGLGEMGTGHYIPEAAKAICNFLANTLIGQDPFEINVLFDKMYKLGANWGRRGIDMGVISGIENAPVFCPVVAPFYSGMEVTVPIFKSMLKNGTTIEDIKNIYKSKYNGPIVNFVDENDEAGFISSNTYSDLDTMEIAVFGNEDRIILTARYDNLGKGASGAAIECLNIVLGQDETTGLVVK